MLYLKVEAKQMCMACQFMLETSPYHVNLVQLIHLYSMNAAQGPAAVLCEHGIQSRVLVLHAGFTWGRLL